MVRHPSRSSDCEPISRPWVIEEEAQHLFGGIRTAWIGVRPGRAAAGPGMAGAMDEPLLGPRSPAQGKRLRRQHFQPAGAIFIDVECACHLEPHCLKKRCKRQKQSCRFNFCGACLSCAERRDNMRPPGNCRDIHRHPDPEIVPAAPSFDVRTTRHMASRYDTRPCHIAGTTRDKSWYFNGL